MRGGKGSEKNVGQERDESMATQAAAQLEEPKDLRPEVKALCSEYLRQTVRFAEEFVKLAELPSKKAPDVENMIIGRCSEAVSMAQLSALDLV